MPSLEKIKFDNLELRPSKVKGRFSHGLRTR